MGVVYDKAVRAVICTASPPLAERLQAMLLHWACRECVTLSAAQTDSCSLLERESAQLVILDMDSVNPPEETPLHNSDAGLIVISGDAGRVIRSYRWHPAAFLKPDFDFRRLADALNACEKNWLCGRLGLESPYRRRSFQFPLGRIRYVEAAAHYCLFDQGKQTVRLRFSIDELERLLPGPPFVRCHRSYLVHLDAVTGMNYTSVVLRGGMRIPLGRTYVRSLREALQAWQEVEKRYDSFGVDL